MSDNRNPPSMNDLLNMAQRENRILREELKVEQQLREEIQRELLWYKSRYGNRPPIIKSAEDQEIEVLIDQGHFCHVRNALSNPAVKALPEVVTKYIASRGKTNG